MELIGDQNKTKSQATGAQTESVNSSSGFPTMSKDDNWYYYDDKGWGGLVKIDAKKAVKLVNEGKIVRLGSWTN